jgi:hypothetical protein
MVSENHLVQRSIRVDLSRRAAEGGKQRAHPFYANIHTGIAGIGGLGSETLVGDQILGRGY